MMFYPMARAKFSRAHLRARQMCAQPPVLEKRVKNEILEHLLWRAARAGVRARQKIFRFENVN